MNQKGLESILIPNTACPSAPRPTGLHGTCKGWAVLTPVLILIHPLPSFWNNDRSGENSFCDFHGRTEREAQPWAEVTWVLPSSPLSKLVRSWLLDLQLTRPQHTSLRSTELAPTFIPHGCSRNHFFGALIQGGHLPEQKRKPSSKANGVSTRSHGVSFRSSSSLYNRFFIFL